MVELQQPEPHPAQETGYQMYIRKRVESLKANPEFHGVYSWYKERIDGMSKMDIVTGPLTDEEKWKHTKTPRLKIQGVSNCARHMARYRDCD